jgi:transcriptional regulator
MSRRSRVPSSTADVLQGTLDLLVLKALSVQPMHGWGVAQRIQQTSREMLQVNQGSLYPALHRLEHRGWIASSWGASDNNRRAKFYRLTPAGRKQLHSEMATWRRFSAAVELVLATS